MWLKEKIEPTLTFPIFALLFDVYDKRFEQNLDLRIEFIVSLSIHKILTPSLSYLQLIVILEKQI